MFYPVICIVSFIGKHTLDFLYHYLPICYYLKKVDVLIIYRCTKRVFFVTTLRLFCLFVNAIIMFLNEMYLFEWSSFRKVKVWLL